MKKVCIVGLMLTASFGSTPALSTGFRSVSNDNVGSTKRQLMPYMGNVVELKDLAEKLGLSADQAFKKALYADKLVVDLYAPWCGPCNALAPALERMANKRKDTLFLKVNIDQYPQISKKYAVRSIPTVLCFRSGQLAGRVTGNNTREIESKAASL